MQFQECQALEEGQGKRIPCLIEHMDNITGPCRHFLNKIATIVFSDYHYVWHFMEHCNADIQRFKCGRSHKPGQDEEGDEEEVTEKLNLHCNKSFKTIKGTCFTLL